MRCAEPRLPTGASGGAAARVAGVAGGRRQPPQPAMRSHRHGARELRGRVVCRQCVYSLVRVRVSTLSSVCSHNEGSSSARPSISAPVTRYLAAVSHTSQRRARKQKLSDSSVSHCTLFHARPRAHAACAWRLAYRAPPLAGCAPRQKAELSTTLSRSPGLLAALSSCSFSSPNQETACRRSPALGETWGGVGRYGEVRGGMGRYEEVWGGVGRFGEVAVEDVPPVQHAVVVAEQHLAGLHRHGDDVLLGHLVDVLQHLACSQLQV